MQAYHDHLKYLGIFLCFVSLLKEVIIKEDHKIYWSQSVASKELSKRDIPSAINILHQFVDQTHDNLEWKTSTAITVWG